MEGERSGKNTSGRVFDPAWNVHNLEYCRDCARRTYTHCPLEVIKRTDCLLKTNQGVTYRAKVRTARFFLIVHAQSRTIAYIHAYVFIFVNYV